MRNTISDISHQLKTPLAALNIYNGILQGEAENLPTIKEFADLSEQELERIETLVQNLLKISKFDAGTIVMERKTENISEMMERIKKSFRFCAGQEEKEIILSKSIIEAHGGSIAADSGLGAGSAFYINFSTL